jgi:hypothetical protein
VSFRVRDVRCERCGEKYSPILRFLDLRERKRRLSSLEKIVAEVKTRLKELSIVG